MVFHLSSLKINSVNWYHKIVALGVISSLGFTTPSLAEVANFDTLDSGFAGFSVTENDITFSNLIAGFRFQQPQFLIQSNSQFEPFFSSPNYLTFGVPDVEDFIIGSFGSMNITPTKVSKSVSLDVVTINPFFGIGDSLLPLNDDSLVLEAFFQGESVARTSVLISDFSQFDRAGQYLSSTLSLSGITFDELQLYTPVSFADGVIPLAVDDVTISAVPEPLTLLGSATAIAFGTQFKRKLTQSKNKKKG